MIWTDEKYRKLLPYFNMKMSSELALFCIFFPDATHEENVEELGGKNKPELILDKVKE